MMLAFASFAAMTLSSGGITSGGEPPRPIARCASYDYLPYIDALITPVDGQPNRFEVGVRVSTDVAGQQPGGHSFEGLATVEGTAMKVTFLDAAGTLTAEFIDLVRTDDGRGSRLELAEFPGVPLKCEFAAR